MKIELQNVYSSRQWIFTDHVYVRCAFALLFLNPQSKCRNITAIKTMANHGNSSIIWEMAKRTRSYQNSVLLLHAKFSIYLGSWALKSYISSRFGLTYLNTRKCSQRRCRSKHSLPWVRSEIRILAKSTNCSHNCGKERFTSANLGDLTGVYIRELVWL